jgi:hypothetical protein
VCPGEDSFLVSQLGKPFFKFGNKPIFLEWCSYIFFDFYRSVQLIRLSFLNIAISLQMALVYINKQWNHDFFVNKRLLDRFSNVILYIWRAKMTIYNCQ